MIAKLMNKNYFKFRLLNFMLALLELH